MKTQAMYDERIICDIEGCDLPAFKTLKEGGRIFSPSLFDLCREHYTEFLEIYNKKLKKTVKI